MFTRVMFFTPAVIDIQTSHVWFGPRGNTTLCVVSALAQSLQTSSRQDASFFVTGRPELHGHRWTNRHSPVEACSLVCASSNRASGNAWNNNIGPCRWRTMHSCTLQDRTRHKMPSRSTRSACTRLGCPHDSPGLELLQIAFDIAQGILTHP